jgi:hypothetical protein
MSSTPEAADAAVADYTPRQLAVHEGPSCECLCSRRHLLIRDEENTERTKLIALFHPPRPGDTRLGMTKIGVLRDEYSATVEGNPPRFVKTALGYEANPAYIEWAQRADAWAVL